MSDSIPWVSTTWAEGRVWDRWMVVHFLSGVSGGLSNVFWNLAPRNLWLVAIGMMVAWEIAEYAKGVRERVENRAIDLAVGLAGVYLATSFAARASDSAEQVAFVVIATLSFVGCYFGWRAYRLRVAG